MKIKINGLQKQLVGLQKDAEIVQLKNDANGKKKHYKK